MITSKNYVKEAMVTESCDLNIIKQRLQDDETIRLLHAAMGLGTEVGELLDMIKKHIFYGAAIDIPNAKEEVGDIEWYAAIAIDVLKTTMDEVLTANISKLRTRYPEKFNEFDALNRDLKKERAIIEEN